MDDIDYLLKHSEKDSTMIILDSSNRDRTKHPIPSEYVIEFSEPFRFVYGFDIIDATIPSTMYCIDDHNNVLFFTIFTRKSVLYDVDRLYDVFRERLELCPGFASMYANQNVVGAISFVFCSIPVDVISDEFDDCYVVFEDTLTRVSLIQYNLILGNGNYDFALDMCRFDVEIGNYNIMTLQAYLKKALKPYNLDIRPASVDDRIDKQMKVRFVHYDPVLGTSHPFFFDMKKSTIRDVLGFDELPSPSETTMYVRQSFVELSSSMMFAASKNKVEGVYDITPPGVINLMGVRYVTLRCPEIESHLLGSFGFSNADIGLGIFKIPSPYETANLKFDFFNFVKKPFHPIGKLNKLSIRFERDPNVLYNFRGINHHILVSLKYYVPTMNSDLTAPILNPNYNPDFLKYMVERDEILNDDDDDDDEYDYEESDESLLKQYVYNQTRH